MSRQRKPAAFRVIPRLTIHPDGCWIWNGATNDKGYGVVMGDSDDRSLVLVHRVMFELFNGQILAGMQVDHLCRVTLCANPMHLEAVTPRENNLRGVGIAARNAAKEACKHGHAFTVENTYLTLKGARRCRQCARDKRAAWKSRQDNKL